MTLVAPARLILWGNGCQSAPRTSFEITPVASGWSIKLDMAGVQIFDRTAPDNHATGELALDADRAAETLEALLADRRPRCEIKDSEFSWSGIGNLIMTLPLSTGDVDAIVNSRDPDRLIALGDVLIELIRQAGLPVNDQLHPVERYKKVRRKILYHAAVPDVPDVPDVPPTDDASAGEASVGFLEMLRPYRGLREAVFADLIAAVRELSPRLRGDLQREFGFAFELDRQLVSALWRICHFGRAWGLAPDGMLRSNQQITPEDVARLEAWISGLSHAVAMLLEGHDDETAFDALPADRG